MTQTRTDPAVIGVTSTPGAGKSTFLTIVQEKYGCGAINMDALTHELLDRPNSTYDKVVARFGADIVVVPTSRAVMLEARAVLADHEGLTKTGTGRGRADPFVIALAGLQSCPVVTQEQGGSDSKPRIPYVCSRRGVACMSMLDVIRAEGWRFS